MSHAVKTRRLAMKFSNKYRRSLMVTANLQGGIGNQLFTFFASYHVAMKHNANLILDKSLNSYSKKSHPDCINTLEIFFGGKKIDFTSKSLNKPRMVLLLERFEFKFFNDRKGAVSFLRQYRSKVFGYDAGINSLSPPVSITGYFQSHLYIDDIVAHRGNISIALSKPTAWFEDMVKEINKCSISAALHVRRGDYIDHKYTLGMLEDQYYLRAITLAKEARPIEKLFIFSDSIEDAEALKAKITDLSCVVVIPPKDSAPTESLLLMSKCDFRIISNSTFSWWAGYLGSDQAKVIAPDPWYRNHEEPEHLIPTSWIRVESKWSV